MDATSQKVLVKDRRHFLDVVDKMVRVENGSGLEARFSSLNAISSTLYEAVELVNEEGAKLPPVHPLREARQHWSTSIGGTTIRLTADLASLGKRYEFARKCGQGRMVCVFGKVKAGKSSLGNFVAYGVPTPQAENVKQADPKPAFFYAAGGSLNEAMSSEKMDRQQSFGIGVGETTSSIQYFSFPGFTWVDTPGIHSVNSENGRLASQYVDAADLVIYTLASSSPERRSDIEEIVNLLGRGKPLLIVITASDIIEEDEGPDGELIQATIMKAPSVQVEQQERVRDLVQKAVDAAGLKDADFSVLSLSARFAFEGACPVQERWTGSGMEAFFSALVERFRTQKLDCRSRVALADLRTSLLKLSEDLKAYEAPGSKFEKAILQKEAEVRVECGAFETDIKKSLRDVTNSLVIKNSKDQLNLALKNELQAAFLALLKERGKNLLGQFGRDQEMQAFRVKLKKPDRIPRYREITETRMHKSELGSNIAAAAGTAIGGIAGAGWLSLITAPVGGFVGKMAGSLLDGEKEVKVSHGLNTGEVFNSAYAVIEDWSRESRKQLQALLEQWVQEGNQTSLSFFNEEARSIAASVNQSAKRIEEELANGNS
ncbi:50S ribosome-binding GTPase [Acetobacter suratthaniensis]|uniref:50S ribosome-binding GTPase n=1 Tax=Acetobacter suratthaniensis TaxID=1502841 RepID=A0ABS3LQE1_9PROT|nr:dynamin family protein [Acetobacter suratthaniensis]MBO1329593.1 50S ribosome-binding GTPase [Acetobacter suratthaniensis]MCX2567607.1 50S ribosome-binding GTPase [Acetobacter suratthaniensis]